MVGGKDEVSDPEYELFEEKFEKLSGIPLNLYKEKQMKRRIGTLIERKHLSGYASFLDLLTKNPSELSAFLDYMTINVTEFFRTPEHWNFLESNVLPQLVSRPGGPLKIWSCACATGEEPYSLAMSLNRIGVPAGFQIIATDLDNRVLSLAAEGVYEENCVAKLPKETLERFFIRKGSSFCVTPEIRSCVEFRKMDLLTDPYPTDCDLIVCRNVLIYFTEDAKNRMYRSFKECLRPGGYLFTGNTEQIIYYKDFGYKKVTNYLYQK